MYYWFLLAGALLVSAVPGLRASSDPTSQQLLDSVIRQHNFIQAARAPFALEAEFTGQANVPLQGHFRIRWQSKDHWWTRVEFGPFQQIRIRNGEMEYIARNYEAAAVEGRVVQIAFQGSPKATVDFRRIMLKRLTHTGSTLRARAVEDKGAIARAVEAEVLPLLAAGRVKPVIDSSFPLIQAPAAHARMESSAHIGKLVLTL